MPKNIWKETAHPGVRHRFHSERKHGVQHDKYFVIRHYVDGERKEEPVGWASEGWTAAKAAALRAELQRNKKTGRGPRTLKEMRKMGDAQRRAEKVRGLTLDHFWETYFEHSKMVKKKSSWEKEESHYRIWISPLLGNVKLQEIGVDEFEKLVEILTKAGKSKRMKEYVTGTLRRILKYAGVKKILDKTPPSGKTIGATGPGNSNQRLRVIRPDEAEAILDKLAIADPCGWKIARFAFLTGCRFSEAANLRWRDLDFVRRTIIFLETKNRDARELPMSEPLEALLTSAPQQSPEDTVFTKADGSVYRESPSSFRTAVKNLGLNDGLDQRSKITFHSIRHTVATNLARNLNLKDLMEIMGWRTVAMAMRYVKGDVDAQETALAELEQGLKPREGKVLPFKRGDANG